MRIVELANPAVIVGVDPAEHPGSHVPAPGGRPRDDVDDGPLRRRGRRSVQGDDLRGEHRPTEADPRRRPGLIDPDANPLLMMTVDGTHMMPGPLYHNGPFVWTVTALLAGQPRRARWQVRRRDDAAADRPLAPRLDVRRADDDGAHLEAAGGRARPIRRVVVDASCGISRAPCPPWLKEAWIDWLGADAIWELYAGHRSAVGDDHHRIASGSSTAVRSAGRCRAR